MVKLLSVRLLSVWHHFGRSTSCLILKAFVVQLVGLLEGLLPSFPAILQTPSCGQAVVSCKYERLPPA